MSQIRVVRNRLGSRYTLCLGERDIDCMLEHDDIYATAPLRRLQDGQMRALVPELQRCHGTHALLLTAARSDAPPATPALGCWAVLRLAHGGYRGDLTAAANEPLPFIDDAFQLILLRHVLEVAPAPAAILDDAVRVLAPGGVLVITGVHPVSAWSAWFCWRGRPRVRQLHFPLALNNALLRAGMEVERIARVGRGWPGGSAKAVAGNVVGGGYVLVARKRHPTITRLRLRRASPVTANGRLSAETRRSAVL